MIKKPLFLISLAFTFMLIILSCIKEDPISTTNNTDNDTTSVDTNNDDTTSIDINDDTTSVDTNNDENSNLEISGTFTDSRDGTVYKWVKIGDQVWMAENLKATEYSDGTAIPLVTDSLAWGVLRDTAKAYCWYDNDEATNKDLYGALYTYAAAINGDNSGTKVQSVCPTGWHLPSDAEWTALIDELGGESVAGNKLKATYGWDDGGNGTDDFGFAALPGGLRIHGIGLFDYAGCAGYWWSSTASGVYEAWVRSVNNVNGEVSHATNSKSFGFSVRCVQD